jgi:hypothetical protein
LTAHLREIGERPMSKDTNDPPAIPPATHVTRDPARYLADYWPTVEVRTAALPDGRRGIVEWPPDGPPRITVSPDLDATARRATLAHEAMHLERGPVDEWETDTEEGEVIRLTARWLLPDLDAVRAAVRASGLLGAAEALGVPARVLLTRLRKMSRAEALAFYGEAWSA